MDTGTILERLIGFPTVSRDSNLDLIAYARALLEEHGVATRTLASPAGDKANLLAVVGPQDRPGVMLSGHTDVVPVEGQDWSVPPFRLTERGGRLHGRGTADMKGFVASALAAAVAASKRRLRTPLLLALSYDEEIGCLGVRGLIEALRLSPPRPLLCIVGEPTGMRVATGHKGKLAARATCTGRAGHSALAPLALNALHLGCDFVGALRDEQERLAREGARDGDYDVPYTTVHAGRMEGGIALNVVPDTCRIDFEIRNVAADDAQALLERLRGKAGGIAARAAARVPEALIRVEATNGYPGLDTPADSEAVGFVRSLVGAHGTTKVAFGTEGGLFSRDLGTPAVVCGPGSMEQGHRPDEFVAAEQLGRCDAMLEALVSRLEAGVGTA